MGQARLRSIEEARVVTLDFAAMDLPYAKAFLRLATKPNDEGVEPDCEALQIARLLAASLISAKWQGKLDRHDGAIWSDWSALIDEGAAEQAEATIGLLKWMQKLVTDEKLAVPFYLAGAREAFSEILDEAIGAAKGGGVLDSPPQTDSSK